MRAEQDIFKVDLEQILKEKLGGRSAWIPKCLVSWLKRTIHQDWMNEFLASEPGRGEGIVWLDGCLRFLGCAVRVRTMADGVVSEGLDALPGNDGGRYFTIVSNHPLGGQDGVALGSIVCHKYDSRMVYLVNDLLMNLKGLAPLCVPINKTGRNSRDFPRAVDAAFQSPANVVMFPAGLCSRKGEDGAICDLEWKKTFIAKSIQYHRDVIPVHFSGHNSDKFYNIARWCKRLRLKVNVAMLYLPDEMYKNRGKTFTVTFGQPIPWQTFDSTRTHAQWAQWVKERVYQLGEAGGD